MPDNLDDAPLLVEEGHIEHYEFAAFALKALGDAGMDVDVAARVNTAEIGDHARNVDPRIEAEISHKDLVR